MSDKIDHRARLIEFTYGHETGGVYALRYIYIGEFGRIN